MNPILLTVFKVAITAAVIVALSELAKRWTMVATIAPSIPIGSGMIAVLLYIDTHDSARAGNYAWNVFLLTPPGSVFLIAMPLCLRAGAHLLAQRRHCRSTHRGRVLCLHGDVAARVRRNAVKSGSIRTTQAGGWLQANRLRPFSIARL